MKIMEFIEVTKNSKNKILKGDQLKDLIAKTLEVKDYIGIKEKKALVDNIVNSCILYEDGVFKFDDIDKYICFTMKTIEAYTNIELSDDIEEDYDALCQAKMLNVVVETFVNEYENVKLLLQMKCDYILSNNCIEAQFGKFLSTIVDKADELSNVLSEKVASFDFDNLPIDMKNINKLIEFVGAQQK